MSLSTAVSSEATIIVKAPVDKIWEVAGNWLNISWLMTAVSVKINGNERLVTYEDGSIIKHVLLEKNDSDHRMKFEMFNTDPPAKMIAHATRVCCELTLATASDNSQETELTWNTQHELKPGVDGDEVKAHMAGQRKAMEKFFKGLFE